MLSALSDFPVMWPLSVSCWEVMQRRECEQVIRADRTALIAKTLRKTILIPWNDTLMTESVRGWEKKENESQVPNVISVGFKELN